MGIGDIFKASENQQLRQRISELESLITPEMKDISTARQRLDALQQEISLQEVKALGLEADLSRIQSEIDLAKKNLIGLWYAKATDSRF